MKHSTIHHFLLTVLLFIRSTSLFAQKLAPKKRLMKFPKSKIILVFLMLSLVSVTYSQDIKLYKKRKSTIDSMLMEEMKNRKIPGLVYGIYGKDTLIMANALGYADVQNMAPTRINTVFELASITKQFTSTAIMILQQKGKLKVTDQVCNYIEDCPEAWKGITFLHLMSHTSGLPGLYGGTGFNKQAYSGIDTMSSQRVRNRIRSWDKRFAFDAIKSDKPITPPGEKFNYSDVGFVLLGIVIDNITGSYRNFLKENIFEPIGMHSTYILDQQTVHPYEARGYSLKNGELINIMRFGQNEIPSHYGIFSNVIDLQKWDEALNSNLILSDESKQIVWSANKLNNGKESNYGMGWFVLNLGKKKIISHSGVTGTEIIKLVTDEVAVCVLTNLGFNDNDRVRSWGLCHEIAKILNMDVFINKAYVEGKGMTIVPMKPNTIKYLIGDYKTKDYTLSIFLEDGKVKIKLPTGEFELVQLNTGDFIYLGANRENILKPIDPEFKQIIINDDIQGIKIKDK